MLTLAEADRLHRCCRNLQIHFHRCQFVPFREFARKLQELRTALGDDAADETWRSFMLPLWRFRKRAIQTGLPFGAAELLDASDLASIESASRRIEHLYISHAPRASWLVSRLRELRLSGTQETAGWVQRVMALDRQTVIATAASDPAVIAATEHHLRTVTGHAAAIVVGPDRLRGMPVGVPLATIGPLAWFPAHVWLAPRASTIHVITYAWLNDRRSDDGVLDDALGDPVCDDVDAGARRASADSEQIDVDDVRRSLLPVGLEELIASIDLDSPHQLEAEESEVDARLFRLAGRRGIFLETDRTVRILDVQGSVDEEDDETEVGVSNAPDDTVQRCVVRRLPLDEIEAGMFILERGPSDDELLDALITIRLEGTGTELEDLLRTQAEWKARLQRQLEEAGEEVVADVLSSNPAIEKYAERNLWNWADDGVILPESRACFDAILELVGLGDKKEEYWSNGELIRRLRREAGHQVTKLLVRQINQQLDLRGLETEGKQRITLVSTSTAMDIYRVESISRRAFAVPRNRTRVSFDLSPQQFEELDREWHG